MTHESSRQQRRGSFFFVTILAGLLFLFALLAATTMGHRTVDTPLADGGRLRVSAPRLCSSVLGTTCEISYQSKGGSPQKITLYAGYVDWTVAAIPSTNINVFYCLYNYDGPLVLLRIDLRKKWTVQKEAQNLVSCLVEVSPFEAQEANVDDWQEALEYIEKLPANTYKDRVVPEMDFGIVRRYTDQKTLYGKITRQMEVIKGSP